MTQTATDEAAGTATLDSQTRPQRTGPSWIRIFVTGLVLWSATVVVTFATRNANLVPTIILLGSFLVPVAFVTYAFGHADEVVTVQRIFTAFIYGGVLGVLGASVLEGALLRQPSGPAYVGVGLIEEAQPGRRGMVCAGGAAAWAVDASRGIAVWLTLLLTSTQVQWLLIELGRAPAVTPAQVHLFTILSWALLALDALLGLVVLRARWRRATAPGRPGTPIALPLATARRR
jgi:hypothetical protein